MNNKMLDNEFLRAGFLLASYEEIKDYMMPSEEYRKAIYIFNLDKKRKFEFLIKRTCEIADLILHKIYIEKTDDYNEIKKINDLFDKYLTRLQKELARIKYCVDMDEGKKLN